MKRLVVVIFVCLIMHYPALAVHGAGSPLETPHLVVYDRTGSLSDEQVKGIANITEDTFVKIVQFWSMEQQATDSGKIRIELERPREGHEASVFTMSKEGSLQIKTVIIFGADKSLSMVAHKLTHAVFPSPDKLIRNTMGIPMEMRFGNYLSFPMCGFSTDTWVLALRETKMYVPLEELGQEHGSWGMSTYRGLPIVNDYKRWQICYSEAASFGNYLIEKYGVAKIKRFYKLSRQKERPWVESFGLTFKELEADWLRTIDAKGNEMKGKVALLMKCLKENPKSVCFSARDIATKTDKR